MLTEGLQAEADHAGIPFTTTAVGGMFGIFFTDQPEISSFAQATACDTERFAEFFQGMLKEGVYLAPSAYETGFMSAAISEEDLDRTIEAAGRVFDTLTKKA